MRATPWLLVALAWPAGCSDVVDVSRRRDAAADLAPSLEPAPPPEREVGLDASVPEPITTADEPCDLADDDADGLVDEGTIYAPRWSRTTPQTRPVELRALGRGPSHVAAAFELGFWAGNVELQVQVIGLDGRLVPSSLSTRRYQPTRASFVGSEDGFVLIGTQRLGCPDAGPCPTFAARVGVDGTDRWPDGRDAGLGLRVAPAAGEQRGGAVAVGDAVWVPVVERRGDGAEALRLRRVDRDGAWHDPAPPLWVAPPGERFNTVRGVAFGDRVAWLYDTRARGVGLVVAGPDGVPRGDATALSPQGHLIADGTAPAVRAGDDLVALVAVSGRGVFLGRWALDGRPRSPLTLVTVRGTHHTLASDGRQVAMVYTVGSDGVFQRFSPSGVPLQAPVTVAGAGETHALTAVPGGVLWLAGAYGRRTFRVALFGCPTGPADGGAP